MLCCELQLISKTTMDMDNTSAMDSEPVTPISALSKEKKGWRKHIKVNESWYLGESKKNIMHQYLQTHYCNGY